MKPTAFIGDDLLPGEICLTPACHRPPDQGTLHCPSCWERIERENWEHKETMNIDRERDEVRHG